ncbi:MAG: hypothetical protein ACT4PE_16470 [Candidatus Eiseniibacteriota bacterium]
MRESLRAHLAMALASFAVLFYQVAITRVLSVVLWYHFAFLSISLALLGVGAPGVWFALRRPRPGGGTLHAALLAAGAAVPLSVVAVTHGIGLLRGAEDIRDSAAGFLDAPVLLTVVAVLVPFLALGAAVCLLLLRAEGRSIGSMYGADLLGATLGAAAVVPLLHVVPTPSLLAAAGLLPLGAALLLSPRSRLAVVLAVLVVIALAWGEPFRLRYTKKYVESGEVLYEKWTPTGRITVFPDVFHQPDPTQAFAWGMGSRWEPRPIEQLWIEQDGSAGTPVTKWTGSFGSVTHLFYDVTSAGYQIRAPESACVIGAGGGRDVLTALAAGVRRVDAVELNPHTVAAVSGPFREFSGDVYHMDGVHPIVAEGRSFLTRTRERYDLIQISMVDSWAATSAGAFALSENHLYTKEAFHLYLDRISDGGLVSVSRWMMAQHLVEGVRLVLLAKAALVESGVRDPGAHLAVVQGGAVLTLLVSRRPFDAADAAALERMCAARGFVQHWPPSAGTPPNSAIPPLILGNGENFRERGLDVSPPTDDRPFFFQTVPVVGRTDPELVARLSVNEQSVLLLRRLVLVVALFAALLFLVPFAFASRFEAKELRRGSAYFAAIGLAFILIETAWVQRFILYLGHPSYATTVVIAALLAGAGFGSFAAGRVTPSKARTAGFALPVLLAGANLALGPIFETTLGWPFAARVALGILLLSPSGLLMGFAFPLGMIRFGDAAKPWFWAMNGAFSVVGSVSSLALAMLAGHEAVGFAGAVCYMAAVLLFRGGQVENARTRLRS